MKSTANRLSPSHLLKGDGISAWRQIADGLEADIEAGRLEPGAQLPAEMQLAARFGVNRHTVRRAIAVLAARGVLRATQGLGTFVEPRPLSYAVGGRARFSENVASAGRAASTELLGFKHDVANAQTAKLLAIKAGSDVLQLQTLRRADGAPLALGLVQLPLPRFAGFEKHFRKPGSLTRALRAFGVSDYRRLETRVTARAASADEARLLEVAPGRAVLITQGVNVDVKDVPILIVHSVFPADRIELTITD
jgi:GntR family phosphonate transport system transcriptional regulator